MKKLLKLLLTACIIAAMGLVYKEPLDDYFTGRDIPCQEMLLDTIQTVDDRVFLLAYNLSAEELQSLWNHLSVDNGDLFHLSPVYEYTLLGDRVLSVSPQYTMSAAEYQYALAEYRSALQDILAGVNPRWTQAQKALYLHDVIALRYAYDESTRFNSAYEMVTEGKAVCQGYTTLYSDLLRACGIDCSYVVSQDMRHTWNVVVIDGYRYNVDVTHDDPVSDRLGRVLHTNFLRSDSALPDHSFSPAEGYGQCTDSTYDSGAVWEGITGAFIPMGDAFYFIKDGSLYKWMGNDTYFIDTINATWYTDESQSRYWTGHYSTLAAAGDVLLYSKPDCIMSYHPETGLFRRVYDYTGTGDIYGMQYQDGILKLQVGTSPNEPGEVIAVTDFYLPQ